jgi:virginiamycin B lyase
MAMIEAEPRQQNTAKGASSPSRQEMRGRLMRDGAFLGGVALACLLVALILTQIGSAPARKAALQPAATPTPVTGGIAQTAKVRVYQVAPNAGLMQPSVDAEGNVWVGEMGTNHLTRVDARSGAVTSWTPPGGQYNIMATTADTRGNVWFTEQAANYIGRFDPRTQKFTTYPLDTVNGIGMGPQDLRFDAHGKLWFTLLSGGRIGRLDPATGAIQTWPVPAPQAGAKSYPFAIAVTPNGQVWFGMLTGGAVGKLDPATGKVTLIHLANPKTEIFSMASDAAGNLWVTEMQTGKLGRIDAKSGQASEIDVPTALGNPSTLYAVAAASNGEVWFASAGANALVRYIPQSQAFTFFVLPTPSSVPYGVAFDSAGKLWFSADGTPANYIGVLSPTLQG